MKRRLTAMAIVGILWVLAASGAQAGNPDGPEVEIERGATITLTKLDVNDQSLELTYRIKNVSDHEVWICDSVGFDRRFEVYMAVDNQTLMIRKRLEVPTAILYTFPPEGRYVRLRPDQERTESVSLTIPVQQDFVYTVGVGTAKRATRLVMEVGFYDEDLPGLIRSIIEEAEKLARPTLDLDNNNISLIARYFQGFLIARYFGGLAGFEEYYYKDPSDQLRIPYMHQALASEQALHITIDGISIEYETQTIGQQNEQTNDVGRRNTRDKEYRNTKEY